MAEIGDIDLSTGIVNITGAKHTVGREGKLKPNTLELLKAHITVKKLRTSDKLFIGKNANNFAENYRHLRNRLAKKFNRPELMGKVESKHGIWYSTTEEQTIKPLEREIVIELPLPTNKWADIARLQVHADFAESLGLPEVAKMEKTCIEKFNETRTIRIKGKNAA